MATTCILRIDGARLWYGFPPETWEPGFSKCCRDDKHYRPGSPTWKREYTPVIAAPSVTVHEHAVFCGTCGARLYAMSCYEADVTLSFVDWKAIMFGAAEQIGSAVKLAENETP